MYLLDNGVEIHDIDGLYIKIMYLLYPYGSL